MEALHEVAAPTAPPRRATKTLDEGASTMWPSRAAYKGTTRRHSAKGNLRKRPEGSEMTLKKGAPGRRVASSLKESAL